MRQGAERAEVTASFSALPPAALAWLKDQSIDFDGELVVRRVIGADGRSRAYVNGQVVPLQALRELAEFLIEIHGQQEFQHLVGRAAQRELLDERLSTPALKSKVAEAFERYSASRREFEALKSAAENRDARLDLLRYQLRELKAEVVDGGGDRGTVCRSKTRGGARPPGGGRPHRAQRGLRIRRRQRA